MVYNSVKKCQDQRKGRELEIFQHFMKGLPYIQKKVDNNPPICSLENFGMDGGPVRLTELEQANRELLQTLSLTYRGHGKVDHRIGYVLPKTNYFNRVERNAALEQTNKRIYETITQEDRVSPYQMKKQMEDFKHVLDAMKQISRFPEYYDSPQITSPLDSYTLYFPEEEKNLPIDKSKRVRCFFDLEIPNEYKVGTMVFEIYRDLAPVASENFIRLCKGFRGKTYKNSRIHKIIPGISIIGGDYVHGNGIGGKPVFGKEFNESSPLRFAGPGVISTYSLDGKFNSQFMITFKALESQNGKFCVFGKMVQSLRALQILEEFGTKSGVPLKKVVISDCGILGKDN